MRAKTVPPPFHTLVFPNLSDMVRTGRIATAGPRPLSVLELALLAHRGSSRGIGPSLLRAVTMLRPQEYPRRPFHVGWNDCTGPYRPNSGKVGCGLVRSEVSHYLISGWLTRIQLVNDTLEDVFDLAEGVVHEALIMSPDLLGIAPIPGLAPVAKTLLHIWNALQKVNVMQFAYVETMNMLTTYRVTKPRAGI